MIKQVDWPEEEGKYYLYQLYHEYFMQADSLLELFNWMIERYKTEKWWDYYPISICVGPKERDISKCEWIDWKNGLSHSKRIKLEIYRHYNFRYL